MKMVSKSQNSGDETFPKEILTPKEAAQYLSVHVRTIYRLAKRGEIPGRKVGGSWRFKKDALDDWLSGKMIFNSKEKE